MISIEISLKTSGVVKDAYYQEFIIYYELLILSM